MSMALAAVSRNTITNAAKPIGWDLGVGQACVRFAQSVVGHLVVICGSAVLRVCNERLERDVLTLRGALSSVAGYDGCVLDPAQDVNKHLSGLHQKVRRLQAASQKATRDRQLGMLHTEARRMVDVCAALQEVIVELQRAIVEHDAKAQAASDDMKRLLADLGRNDDVPPGHYGELASALNNIPQSKDEDRSGDPRPL